MILLLFLNERSADECPRNSIFSPEKGCRRVTDGSWHRELRQTEKIKMPTNDDATTARRTGKIRRRWANVENQASPKQREAPAASEGGSFQISISICPCRCSRDGSRDNDTTTINDSSRVVSRWAPDIFDAKPSYNTPSNIYIVVRAIAFYLICPSKPINERHFPDQRCESITETTFPNPLHGAFFHVVLKVNDTNMYNRGTNTTITIPGVLRRSPNT